MTQINRHAYAKLIAEDIEEMNKAMPEVSLERRHIEEVLRQSVEWIYDEPYRLIDKFPHQGD